MIPGSTIRPSEHDSRIPILLVQQPGSISFLGFVDHFHLHLHLIPPLSDDRLYGQGSGALGFGAGWDLIIPEGWGMAFWLPIVYAGARAAGVLDRAERKYEQLKPCEPYDYPDTPAGADYMATVAASEQARFNSLPPAKRPNYASFGISSPFGFDFVELLQRYSTRPVVGR